MVCLGDIEIKIKIIIIMSVPWLVVLVTEQAWVQS